LSYVFQASVGSDESVSTLASESTAAGDQTSRARVTLLRKQLRDRDKQLSEKDAQMAQLRSQLEVKDRVIVERDAEVNSTKLLLASCEAQLASQTASLGQLREALNEAAGGSGQDLTTKSQLQVC
jgi:chromosome segregation ATPase